MSVKLKKLRDQVIVITGASSGIGLTTAEMAAQAGARVMLSSRNEQDLRSAVEDIRARGGEAAYHVADVADERAMEQLAERTTREYGGIDTWVNNAGVSMYGRLEDSPMEDKRRLFDVNFWGVVNGSKAALPHLKRNGGALINIGSVLSDIPVPVQGIYAASKHALKAYTSSLRMELANEAVPVSVTLVKPSAIDTPYTEHARSHMAEEPGLPAPAYAPEVVARAILRCAEKPVREITVGGAGRFQILLHTLAPSLAEAFIQRAMPAQMKRNEPSDERDSLYRPMSGRRRYGPYSGRVMQSSAYTRAALSDVARVLPVLALGAGLVALSRRRRPGTVSVAA
ncbi:MAG: SDR family NAD(P)-dependent oxidoreductase [Acidobacteria bacterium]|nr:MAG: SDR family NAD(P)-dependent oxidoreductase [Acidobacteriota bacterium]RPJ77091.1 MAG: SDR family NAD(P)-dependent oxidoreductase [Acidobacteriota bacterium]